MTYDVENDVTVPECHCPLTPEDYDDLVHCISPFATSADYGIDQSLEAEDSITGAYFSLHSRLELVGLYGPQDVVGSGVTV